MSKKKYPEMSHQEMAERGLYRKETVEKYQEVIDKLKRENEELKQDLADTQRYLDREKLKPKNLELRGASLLKYVNELGARAANNEGMARVWQDELVRVKAGN